MASTKAQVHSFEDAESFLAGGRNKRSRVIANNTYVERCTDDRIAIRLHNTNVVEFTRSGLIILNSGGWRTVTTKDRIHTFLPAGIYLSSIKGVWHLVSQGDLDGTWTTHWSVPFADHITIRQINGEWQPVAGTFPDPTEQEKIAVARKSLNKLIAAYLLLAEQSFIDWKGQIKDGGKLNVAGDPWCCTMGFGAQDNDHLWKHLQDGYVFPTLFKLALEDSGRYRDPVQRFLMDLQFGFTHRLKADLKKYLLKKLDPALAVQSSTQNANRWIEAASDVLTKPSDFGYFGSDESLWVTSAPTWTKHRDSENLEIVNFEIVWETLVAEFPALAPAGDRKDENPGGFYVFGCGHWAVGWTEQIVVPVLKHPGLVSASNLHPAFLRVCELGDQTKLYPALPGAENRAAVLDAEDALL